MYLIGKREVFIIFFVDKFLKKWIVMYDYLCIYRIYYFVEIGNSYLLIYENFDDYYVVEKVNYL